MEIARPSLSPLALEVCANLRLFRKPPGWRQGLLLAHTPIKRGEMRPCVFLVQKSLSGPNPCPIWGCWTLNNDPAPQQEAAELRLTPLGAGDWHVLEKIMSGSINRMDAAGQE